MHSIKYPAVSVPNGLCVHLSGLFESKKHDAAMLYESKMLQDLQQSSIDTNSNILCICEDPAYTANLNTDQRAWNGAMSSVKVSVEWLFGDIKNF